MNEWCTNGLFTPIPQAFIIHFPAAQNRSAKDQDPREASVWSGLQQTPILVGETEPDTDTSL